VSPAPRGPMKMPKPSEEAKAAFSKLVPDEPAVGLKPMFGQLSAFVNGNMFCGLFGDDLVVRLPEAEIAKVKMEGGRDFEPMAGHKMSGYVMVPSSWRSKPAPSAALIKRALAVTREMPAKTPKKAAGPAAKQPFGQAAKQPPGQAAKQPLGQAAKQPPSKKP
jgi:TfoX/Sxy family transcriptional regulator of competence genes